MSRPRSDALVLFGITGDLAHKKLFPALYAMAKRGHLDVPVIGVARSRWTLDQLRERARDSVQQHGEKVDERAFAQLAARLRFVDGDYREATTYERLKKELGAARYPAHYLALPPSLFPSVVQGLGRSSCARDAR